MIRAVHVFAFVLLSTTTAVAQTQGTPATEPAAEVSTDDAAGAGDAPSRETRFEILAGVWLPRLRGDVTFGAGAIDLEDGLELNDTETTLNLELGVGLTDDWGLWFGGFQFDTDTSGSYKGGVNRFGDVLLLPGDSIKSSLDFDSYGGEVFYQLPGRVKGDDSAGNLRFRFLGGGRYFDIDQTVERVGGPRDSASGEWFAVYGGLGLRVWSDPAEWLPLFRNIYLDAPGAVGGAFGGGGGWMWQVRAHLTVDVVENVGLLFGYRLLELDADDGAYNFNGGLQGLFLGGSIRF